MDKKIKVGRGTMNVRLGRAIVLNQGVRKGTFKQRPEGKGASLSVSRRQKVYLYLIPALILLLYLCCHIVSESRDTLVQFL